MNFIYKIILSIYNFNVKLAIYLMDKNKEGKIYEEEGVEAGKTVLEGFKIIKSHFKKK